jgi:type 2 lantibiotic biosynthesis protein LanM
MGTRDSHRALAILSKTPELSIDISSLLFDGLDMRGLLDSLAAEAASALRIGLDESDPRGAVLDRAAICGRFAENLRAELAAVTRPSSADEAASREALERRYPVLARLIEEVRERSVAATAETAARFVRDRGEIIDTLMLGADPGRLVGIEPTTGDPHQRGRRVAFLHFADRVDPLVYKPRPAESAAFYAELIGWLNARLPDLGLADARTIVEAGYGWAAYIRPTPCRAAKDAELFYYRQGALLAILHAANGTDAHADNIIAHGDQPILIDTETLLHPVLGQASLLADPAMSALEESVHQTILLPTLMHDERGTADVSGLGGHGDSTPHGDGARARGRAASPPANRPVLDGRPLEPSGYLPELLAGFGDAYAAISRDADAFIEVLDGAADSVMRLVARPTQSYAELLADSLAPEALRDEAGRQGLFEKLAAEPTFDGSARLLDHEYRDLRDHDIPIFFARPGSRSAWTSRGEEVAEVLTTSGLDGARAKVRAMNNAELRRQGWIIDAAFATGAGPISHHSAGSVRIPGPAAGALDPQWTVDQAVRIAGLLGECAYRGHGRVNWLGLEPLEDDHWRLLPAGGGLPHGYPGVALFLAQLGAITGGAEFLERAAEAISPLPLLLDAIADRPAHLESIGCGFAGLGGIVYTLARLSTLLESPELARRAAATVELVARSGAGSDADSYTDGRAGAVAALRAVHRELGVPEAAELAGTLAERSADPGVEPIAAADDGWCRGTAGAAAAGRLESAALEAWLDRLADTGPVSDLSLCHGELGILDSLAILGRGHDRAREVLERRGAALPSALEHGARLVGTPGSVPTPGLLHGLAGAGYGLLRTGFADLVPSVLMMEPAPGADLARAAGAGSSGRI